MENTLTENYRKLQHNAEWLLTTIKPATGRKEHLYTASINFSSYSSLICTVNDLMKLTTLALLSDEPHVSDTVQNPIIDLANIVELAIQLMPVNEAEFLDEARRILSLKPAPEPEPEYNYSTLVILSKKKKVK